MERLEVKDQEGKFEEVPGILTLFITMTKRQDDNKRKDKRTALFRRAGLWGSGSTGKHAIKILKTEKKTKSATMVYIYIYIYICIYALKIQWICFLLFFFSFCFAR